MEEPFSRFQHQSGLAARLRELGGEAHPGFLNQKDFFISALRAAEEPLAALQRESYREACGRFLGKLGKGRATPEFVAEFKDPLDKLLSGKDFALMEGGLPGSPEVVRGRLASLRPLSIAEGERTGTLRDSGAERLVAEAYRRLGFDSLEKELAGRTGDQAYDAVLLKARRSVADYCRMYQAPPSPEDTLPAFSLSRIDAVLGACYRLLSRLRMISWENTQRF
jgi:hypothetical protein